MGRLKEKYNKEIRHTLGQEFGIKNLLAAPSVEKVTLNMGIGEVAKNQGALDALKHDFAMVAGQMPSVRAAKISVAGFSVRAGQNVGLSVTLRGERMYSFLDRFFSITLPRLRDFRGIPLKGFDKSGNYTLGMTEHTVFPEIDMARSASPHGMEITIVISRSNPEKSKRLLELLGCPFEKGNS